MRNTLEQQKPLVVLVEDTAAIRELLGVLLSQNGFALAEFETPESALAEWPQLQENAALLISDAMMNGEDGLRMIAAMRRSRPTLPVLVISGSGTPPQGMPPGCAFLAKPFAMQELLQVVRELLAT